MNFRRNHILTIIFLAFTVLTGCKKTEIMEPGSSVFDTKLEASEDGDFDEFNASRSEKVKKSGGTDVSDGNSEENGETNYGSGSDINDEEDEEDGLNVDSGMGSSQNDFDINDEEDEEDGLNADPETGTSQNGIDINDEEDDEQDLDGTNNPEGDSGNVTDSASSSGGNSVGTDALGKKNDGRTLSSKGNASSTTIN